MLSIIKDFFNKTQDELDYVPYIEEQLQILRQLHLKSELTKIHPPRESCNAEVQIFQGDYSIGFSYNLLNNSYIFCKIARQHGIKAELFLEPNFAELISTSLPFWEECSFKGDQMPANDSEIVKNWKNPDYVKTAQWGLDVYNKIKITFEYKKLKKLLSNTAVSFKGNNELLYLEAYSILPHLELLVLFNNVDILHVSGTHIGLASFTNKPYVTFPFGDDLYDIPFRNNEIGWLQARGFFKATRHIASGECMLDYLDSLHISRSKIDLLPFMVNTDEYAPLPENAIKDELHEKYQGKTIFLVGARQNWYWKGSDKLLRAIAKLCKREGDSMVFLMAWYGQDLDKSCQLIKDLGIERNIMKLGIISKPLLKRYIDAADVCVDQFTLGSFGTFALESMSIGTPLITYYSRDRHFKFDDTPPILHAFSEDEIYEQLLYCVNNKVKLQELGRKHRQWLIENHGHKKLWPSYDEVYRKALAAF
jgi:hypothetical protein